MTTRKIWYGSKELKEDLAEAFEGVTFGELLKDYRRGEGMGQEDLAVLIGTTKAGVCDMEKGRKIPTAKRAYSIAVALRIHKPLCVQLAFQDILREQKINLKVSVA